MLNMVEQSIKQIQEEVAEMKEKIDDLIEILRHLEEDIHDEKFEVRNDYIEKLNRLENSRFLTQKEFEKAMKD